MGRLTSRFVIIFSITSLAAGPAPAGWEDSSQPLTLPLRINCGGPALGEPGSRDYWRSDETFLVRGTSFNFKDDINTRACEQAAPLEVYQSVRRNAPAYRFPGLPDGTYLVRLHFSDSVRQDNRRMNFWLQDCKLLSDFSIVQAARGNRRACVMEFVVEASRQRGLEIRSSRGTGDDAFIAGIEIHRARKNSVLSIEQDLSTKRPMDLEDRVREFGQGPVRLVWCRTTDPKDSFCEETDAMLCGFDTEDSAGERQILDRPGRYAKPMLTPDGTQVVFTDQQSKRCYVAGFDGQGLRELGRGFASDVWDDPQTRMRWVYIREGEGGSSSVVRRQLQNPGIVETVWSAGETGQPFMAYFRVSRDGQSATDCFPWPNVGLADLKSGRFQNVGNGCWPDIAVDGSGRYSFFRGSHASLALFDSAAPEGRRVNLDTIGGWIGRPVFHPRWSRHPRHLTVTAPESSAKAELYIGRFDGDYKRIEAWRRITYNDKPECFGDAWFGNSPMTERQPVQTMIAAGKETAPPDGAAAAKGLVFVWKNQRADNAITDSAGKTLRLCRATMTGRSRPSLSQGADLRDGALVPDAESCKAVISACLASKAISLAFVTEAGRDDLLEPAVVACVENAAREPLLMVLQKKDTLIAEFLAADGKRKEMTLGQVVIGKAQHWQLSFDSNSATALANVQCIAHLDSGPAFDRWQGAELRFGSDGAGRRPWRGCIEGIEIFDRPLASAEISRRHVSLQKAWSARKPQRRIQVEAELLQSSRAPDPSAIRPYRRSLAENIYRVRKVISGSLDTDRLVVLQWCILDGAIQALRITPGNTITLSIEAMEDHPEISGEHRASDVFEPGLPVFYDLDPVAAQ